MKTTSFIILCFFCSLISKAQDTIFLKTSEKIAVFVKEVSQTEVQYKKAELPDGPLFIINKSDIGKIVYKNGYTEIIKSAVEEKPFVVQYQGTPDINNEKITYKDSKKRYFYLAGLVNRHPDPNRRPELMKAAKGIKSSKGLQDGMRTGAIVCGALTIATGVIYGIVNAIATNGGSATGAPEELAIPPIALGSLAVVFTAVAITANVGLQKKRKKFVDLYNQ